MRQSKISRIDKVAESGNATEEQVLDAQRAMEEAQQEANEAQKRSLFDELSDEDGGPPPPPPN